MHIRTQAGWAILALALPVFVGGCSKPKSQTEQISYTIGAQFGRNLKGQNLKLNSKFLAKGIEDALKKDKLAMTDDEMQSAMAKMNEEHLKEMVEVSKANKLKAEEFLAKNKTADGVKTTPSGLQYKIMTEGKGPSPHLDDTVIVNYKGTLLDGTEFDSSYKRGQPAEFPLKGIIPGWTEGLQLMKKGGKTTLFIPPELAYQDRPRQTIPPNSLLIFEVELVDIKPPAAPVKKK